MVRVTVQKIKLVWVLPLILLMALSNHRSYSSNYIFGKGVYTKYGPASYKESKKKTPIIVIIKKKSKTKGIKVSVPQISESITVKGNHFTHYVFPNLSDVFTQSYPSVNFERGPPAC